MSQWFWWTVLLLIHQLSTDSTQEHVGHLVVTSIITVWSSVWLHIKAVWFCWHLCGDDMFSDSLSTHLFCSRTWRTWRVWTCTAVKCPPWRTTERASLSCCLSSPTWTDMTRRTTRCPTQRPTMVRLVPATQYWCDLLKPPVANEVQ